MLRKLYVYSSNFAYFVAVGLGSGLSPIAPGTVGTLVAWGGYVLLDRYIPSMLWILLVLISGIIGVYCCNIAINRLHKSDPSSVVWDEIVAFWFLLWLADPNHWLEQLLAFVLFRFFDIYKPEPIRFCERNIKGGAGVMFDDLVAAVYAWLILILCRIILKQ